MEPHTSGPSVRDNALFKMMWPFPIKISVSGISIKMRTGKILNSKTDWDAPSLITLERNIRRGLWLLWLQAITNFLTSSRVISPVHLVISFAFVFFFYFAVLSITNSLMFEKARCAKHVTPIIISKLNILYKKRSETKTFFKMSVMIVMIT